MSSFNYFGCFVELSYTVEIDRKMGNIEFSRKGEEYWVPVWFVGKIYTVDPAV
jgi:hypothetical protein